MPFDCMIQIFLMPQADTVVVVCLKKKRVHPVHEAFATAGSGEGLLYALRMLLKLSPTLGTEKE